MNSQQDASANSDWTNMPSEPRDTSAGQNLDLNVFECQEPCIFGYVRSTLSLDTAREFHDEIPTFQKLRNHRGHCGEFDAAKFVTDFFDE